MDRIDALGADTVRLEAFQGAVLDLDTDGVLQEIVAAAAAATGCRIALVSLVLRRVQYFRAHVGLPERLAAAPATDRCASFCQLVVATRQPIVVEDAVTDPRVPQELVVELGVRAYLGQPLVVDEQVVGTLCALDTEPRRFDDEARAALTRLGAAAVTRLIELGATRRQDDPPPRVEPSQGGGAARLRDELVTLGVEVALCRIAAVETRLRMLALAATPAPATDLLRDAADAVGDLEAGLARIERGLRTSQREARALLAAEER